MLPTIVSFANIGYKTFSENLLRNIKDRVHNHDVVFYCLDAELYDILVVYKSDRIQIIKYTEIPVTDKFVDFGNSIDFRTMMNIKMEIIRSAVQKYSFIHFVDGDVVFCKEPTPEYYSAYAQYDIVYQSDSFPPNPPYSTWTCTGNFTLRNTERTMTFLSLVQDYQNRKEVAEQEAQQMLFQEANIRDIRNYPHAKLTEFPRDEFTPGFIVKDNLIDFRSIMVFHANHVTGFELKRHLLKKIGMWYMD